MPYTSSFWLIGPRSQEKRSKSNYAQRLRCSSSPGFEIINNPYSGDINDGMTVQAAIDSHLEMEGDWAGIDQDNNDQEEEDWDEQGHVMEGEESYDIYKDDELEELEGEELKAGLKLVMENQLKRIQQRNELKPLCGVLQHLSRRRQSQRGVWVTVVSWPPGQKGSIGRRSEKLKFLIKR